MEERRRRVLLPGCCLFSLFLKVRPVAVWLAELLTCLSPALPLHHPT